MNLFNRIFTVVSLVFLTLIGTASLVIPGQMLQFVPNVANAIHDGILGGISDTGRLVVRLVAAVVLIIIIFLLLWLEVRRGGSRHVEVAKSSGGRIRIHTSDVEQSIQQQVDAISGILTSHVHVNERDRAVVAKLDVQSAPGVDLVAKGEEVAAVTRIAVQDQLGLKLYGKPLVTIKSTKPKTIATPVVAPAPQESTNRAPGDKA